MKVLLPLLATIPLACQAVQYSADALGDEITGLPGLNEKVDFRMFSGYVPVGDNKRALFYWFVESEQDPDNAPLILWTNGGPGCSGLSGFLTEQGPFRPAQNLTLSLFEYRWNKIANMIFIEQPAGVGFSWTDDAFLNYGDALAASDNYDFIVGFLNKFDAYRDNDFYLTSESYGGHYLPTLSKFIVERNNAEPVAGVNFKGMMVGNPLTWMPYRDFGQWATYAGHQMLPKPLWDQYLNLGCNETEKIQCRKLEEQFYQLTQHIDPYALDFPTCADDTTKGGRHERYMMSQTILNSKSKERKTKLGRYFPTNYVPCSAEYATNYLNSPEVRAAIHVDENKSPVWTECDGTINSSWNQTDLNAPMMPIYKWLINNADIQIVIYSGDDDSVCATAGSQMFIWDLAPMRDQWKAWEFGDDGQLGGYITKFTGFTFLTVHGAGHMVPSTRPEQGFHVLEQFLAGNLSTMKNKKTVMRRN